jgi:hypothetical protein
LNLLLVTEEWPHRFDKETKPYPAESGSRTGWANVLISVEELARSLPMKLSLQTGPSVPLPFGPQTVRTCRILS